MRILFYFIAITFGISLTATVSAQSASQFKYDGFSFDQDPLFGKRIWSAPSPPVIPQQQDLIIEPAVERLEPETSTGSVPEPGAMKNDDALSQADQFTLQMEIDKAHSRILKLTLDYNALRNQIERFAYSGKTKKGSASDFVIGRDKELEALVALNRKQLTERDKQLQVLQTRLDAIQKRYDNENVSRLLAEKQLKILQDQDKKSKARQAKTSTKVTQLAKQLKTQQNSIRQLKIQLTEEKLKTFKLEAELKGEKPQ